MKYLIVGGDSKIGNALYHAVGDFYTTRRKDGSGYFLDLEDPNTAKLPKTEIAIICAAITNKEKCEKEKDKAFRINCANTLTVCNKLQEQDTRIIFLSSDAVFDNSHYGYTKTCMEKALDHTKSTIIRLSKVITKDCQLFKDWYEKLNKDIPIRGYYNVYTAPIYIDYVVDSIIKIAESERKGIYQLSASNKVSYYKLAQYMAKKLDKKGLVKKQFGDSEEFTLMPTKRFQYLTKEKAPSSYNAIDQWIKNYEK